MLQVSSAISSAQIEYSELTARLRDLRRQVIAEDNEEARETLRREFASAKNRQGDIEAQYLVQKRQIAQFIEVIETKQDLAAEYQSRAQAQVASLQIRQTDLRGLKERFVSVKARNSAIARVKNRVVTKKNEIRNRRNIASDNGNNGNSGNSNSNSNSNSN